MTGDYEPSALGWVREHVEQVVRTGTTDGITMKGSPVVLMTYRGAKTGKVRRTPVMRVEHQGRYAAVASKGGEPANPHWYASLIDEPLIELQDGTVTRQYRAREVSGDERALWWRRAADAFPDFAGYQRNTARQIPVFVLEPVSGGAALPPFEAKFARAWDTPGYTRRHLPDTDVNEVLAARYATSAPLAFTRTMLWDMEVRKAARPGSYIPSVVQAESDRAWNRHPGDGGEYLDRRSMQRLWLAPQRHELILERAFLNHAEQKITFLGVPELTGPDGTPLHAGTGQPLFHVEHSVGGTESRPVNQWRIVHLTQTTDDQLTAVFGHMADSPWLAEHTEIYIRHNLGLQLTRKPA